ncbi:MAG: hypothetical protein M0P31_16010 [Solirubrobacteraceae bacterium]|nr:hypothetical protein [Solirubrobacteraceae bacterium]
MTSSIHPPLRRLALLAVALLTAVVVLTASAAPADAASCRYSAKEGRAMGPSYVTSIQVTRTSCATGKKVVKAFHKCRGSQTGRCRKAVVRYRCTERRGKTLRGQFSSKVTCKRGKARVVHTFTEFV